MLPHLPQDLLLRVVSYLDNHTILTFLTAFPHLKPLTMLITDHPAHALYFHIDGVARRVLNGRAHRTRHSLTHGDKSRFPIRLVELTRNKTLKMTHSDRRQGKYTAFDASLFNATTFVFLHYADPVDMTSGAGLGDSRRVQKMLDRGVKWHCGMATYPVHLEGKFYEEDELGLMMSGFPPVVSTMELLKQRAFSIKHLRIEGVNTIQSLVFPQVQHLSIYFHASTERPKLQNIIAPKATELLIHYSGTIPIINGISCCKIADPQKKHRFELANTNGMTMSQDWLLHPVETAVDKVNLRFLRDFTHLTLSGVPDFVLQSANLDNITSFIWTKSIPDQHNKPWTLQIPNLTDLRITMSSPKTTLPELEAPSLQILQILILSHHTDVKQIFKRLGTTLTDLQLIQDQALVSPPKPSRFSMSATDWGHALSSKTLSTLTLFGFEMPFLNHFNHVCRLSITPWVETRVVLRPVIGVCDEGYKDEYSRCGTFTVDVFSRLEAVEIDPFNWANCLEMTLDVDPIVAGGKGGEVRFALYEMKSVIVRVSPVFERCLVNGEVLDMGVKGYLPWTKWTPIVKHTWSMSRPANDEELKRLFPQYPCLENGKMITLADCMVYEPVYSTIYNGIKGFIAKNKKV